MRGYDAGMTSRPALLAILLAAAGLMLGGCRDRQVRIEISAAGEQTGRVFLTNQTDRSSTEAIAQLYGSEGKRDDTLGLRFSGTFSEGALPSEIGNRGAISRIDSALGSTRAYYEQFADPRPEWSAMRDRVESGILWMKLFGRFVEVRKLPDADARRNFRTWWEGEMIPLAADAYLMYSGMQAVVQAQRIGVMPRRAEDFGARTDDESFQLTVFQPLVILLAERGYLTPTEFAAAQVLGIDGNFSSRERAWATDQVFIPAITRVLVRFDPTRKATKLADFAPLGLEFLLWLKISREYRDIALDSPALAPEVKESIRAGKWEFELPPPFGFRVMEKPKVTSAEVSLDTGARPFLTNGVWDPDAKRVRFKGAFFEGKYRYTPYNPPYYALWSLASQRQESCFGGVILEGEPLAAYCAWEAALDDALRKRWFDGLDALAARQDARPCFETVVELAREHPIPLPLARWLAERVGEALPPGLEPEAKPVGESETNAAADASSAAAG
ncbi:MAG: hypothetical protein RLZZ238_1391 [Planctomycetota bacterium]